MTARKLPALKGGSSVAALAVALVMTLVNQFYLEPKSTNIMMQRYALDDANDTDTDEYRQLRAQFGKLHGMSSLTNLVALCAGVVHAVGLSGPLAL